MSEVNEAGDFNDVEDEQLICKIGQFCVRRSAVEGKILILFRFYLIVVR
jgi:hypothetical protein